MLLLRSSSVCLLLFLPVVIDALAYTAGSGNLFLASRSEALNLLNHPLQLQLATGDLPLGSFQRLVTDRQILLEGLTIASDGLLDDELAQHHKFAASWLQKAQEAGKTINVPDGIKCFSCGGPHLNIDCPEDSGPSQSVLALKSILQTNGLAGATGVLRSYSFACSTILKAMSALTEEEGGRYDPVYHDWLKAHADPWSELADLCEEKLDMKDSSRTFGSYSICLSMLYNWIDGEAATTGIRADLVNDPQLSSLLDAMEELEPGYAAQRDKHESFVAEMGAPAEAKVNAAAAYLVAKKKSAADKAAAYLMAKKAREEEKR